MRFGVQTHECGGRADPGRAKAPANHRRGIVSLAFRHLGRRRAASFIRLRPMKWCSRRSTPWACGPAASSVCTISTVYGSTISPRNSTSRLRRSAELCGGPYEQWKFLSATGGNSAWIGDPSIRPVADTRGSDGLIRNLEMQRRSARGGALLSARPLYRRRREPDKLIGGSGHAPRL